MFPILPSLCLNPPKHDKNRIPGHRTSKQRFVVLNDVPIKGVPHARVLKTRGNHQNTQFPVLDHGTHIKRRTVYVFNDTWTPKPVIAVKRNINRSTCVIEPGRVFPARPRVKQRLSTSMTGADASSDPNLPDHFALAGQSEPMLQRCRLATPDRSPP